MISTRCLTSGLLNLTVYLRLGEGFVISTNPSSVKQNMSAICIYAWEKAS